MDFGDGCVYWSFWLFSECWSTLIRIVSWIFLSCCTYLHGPQKASCWLWGFPFVWAPPHGWHFWFLMKYPLAAGWSRWWQCDTRTWMFVSWFSASVFRIRNTEQSHFSYSANVATRSGSVRTSSVCVIHMTAASSSWCCIAPGEKAFALPAIRWMRHSSVFLPATVKLTRFFIRKFAIQATVNSCRKTE